MIDDDVIYDEDLLKEAARYAVSIQCPRNRFMTWAKREWWRAVDEAGLDPQTLKPLSNRPKEGRLRKPRL